MKTTYRSAFKLLGRVRDEPFAVAPFCRPWGARFKIFSSSGRGAFARPKSGLHVLRSDAKWRVIVPFCASFCCHW